MVPLARWLVLGMCLFPLDSVAPASIVETPAMIYGTAWKKGRTHDLVKLAIQQGFRVFDTSNMPKHYNESLVGSAIAEALQDPALGLQRASFWIQTKFTPDACDSQPLELQPYDTSKPVAERVRASLLGSLQHLGVDYVDSLLLHAPFGRREDTLAAWRELEMVHDEGSAHEIGVSNFNSLELKWLLSQARVPPAFVQNRCLHKDGWDKEVRELCIAQGIRYQGFWLLTGNRFFSGSTEIGEIAQRHGKTRQQVVFAFVMQQHLVIPLTGTQNAGHMVEDLAMASGNFSLAMDELAVLQAVGPESFTDTDPVQVTFHNYLHAGFHLFWEHPDSGKLFSQGIVQAGGFLKQSTYHSHIFVMKKGDQVVQRWRANREEGEMQIVRVDSSVQVQFMNAGKAALHVFWKDNTGAEVLQGKIEAGQSLTVKTFVNDGFTVKDASHAVVHKWVATAHTHGKHYVEVHSGHELAQGRTEM